MGINKKIREEKQILEKLEFQLEKLLNTIKPSENLKGGDIFVLKKNVILPYYGEIKNGNSIRISEIIEGIEGETTVIKYQIIGETNEELEMSKWIFIGYFCDEIKSEEAKIIKNINELKNLIKIEKNKIKDEKIGKHSDEVKHKVHFLLGLTKTALKHLKLSE